MSAGDGTTVIEHNDPHADVRDSRRRDATREGMRLARERAERDAEVRADAESARDDARYNEASVNASEVTA